MSPKVLAQPSRLRRHRGTPFAARPPPPCAVFCCTPSQDRGEAESRAAAARSRKDWITLLAGEWDEPCLRSRKGFDRPQRWGFGRAGGSGIGSSGIGSSG